MRAGIGCNRSDAAVKPRISVITLCVNNLERAVAFYRDGLGLPTSGVVGIEFEHGAVAFFQLQPGLRLALWPRASLAYDAGIPLEPVSRTDVVVSHNVSSEVEVDTIMAHAARAGAEIVKPARKTFWGGYAGYIQDPDRHLWEIVWNPHWETPV